MPAPPISIKLACTSWGRVASIHQRDLTRGALFLKTKNPPPLGTSMQVHLVLPSQTVVILNATVAKHVGPGEMGGRGPGVDLKLQNVPKSALWLIESAVKRAEEEENAAGGVPASSSEQAAPSPTLPLPPPVPQAGADDDDRTSPVRGEDARDEDGREVDIEVVDDDDVEEVDDADVEEADEHEDQGREIEIEVVDDDDDVEDVGEPSREVDFEESREVDFSRRSDRQAMHMAGTMAAADDPDSLEAKLVKGLGEQLARVRIMTPEQILGVPPGVDEAALRMAFAQRSKRYRPDNFARFQDERIRSQAAEIFILIHKAFDTLARGAAGEASDSHEVPASGSHEVPGTGAATAAQPEAAGGSSKLKGPGFDLIDAGRLKEARGFFVKARRLDPDDPVVSAGLELTEGLMAFEDGDRLEAAQRFEAVLMYDPENPRALTLLTEIKKRAAEERKSHLERLREQTD